MKFYIASSLSNKQQVRYVSEQLKKNGFTQTYDWTLNENITSIAELIEIGQKEKDAVLESDFIIVLLPGGKGTHIELGIAIGQGKRVYLYSPDRQIEDVESTTTFYHLPEVQKYFGTVDELVEVVLSKHSIR